MRKYFANLSFPDDRRNLNKLSTLTTPSNRNPRGTTLPCCARPVAAGAVEVAFATFIFDILGQTHRSAPTLHIAKNRVLVISTIGEISIKFHLCSFHF